MTYLDTNNWEPADPPGNLTRIESLLQLYSFLDLVQLQDLLLLDVTPFTLGINIIGGIMYTIISRSARIPAMETESFVTTYDDQTSLSVKVKRPFKTDFGH